MKAIFRGNKLHSSEQKRIIQLNLLNLELQHSEVNSTQHENVLL